MELSPHTYGYDSIRSLLDDSLNENIEIAQGKFGPMIRVKPGDTVVSKGPEASVSVSDSYNLSVDIVHRYM